METPLKPNDRIDMVQEKLLSELAEEVYNLQLRVHRIEERLQEVDKGE